MSQQTKRAGWTWSKQTGKMSHDKCGKQMGPNVAPMASHERSCNGAKKKEREPAAPRAVTKAPVKAKVRQSAPERRAAATQPVPENTAPTATPAPPAPPTGSGIKPIQREEPTPIWEGEEDQRMNSVGMFRRICRYPGCQNRWYANKDDKQRMCTIHQAAIYQQGGSSNEPHTSTGVSEAAVGSRRVRRKAR